MFSTRQPLPLSSSAAASHSLPAPTRTSASVAPNALPFTPLTEPSTPVVEPPPDPPNPLASDDARAVKRKIALRKKLAIDGTDALRGGEKTRRTVQETEVYHFRGAVYEIPKDKEIPREWLESEPARYKRRKMQQARMADRDEAMYTGVLAQSGEDVAIPASSIARRASAPVATKSTSTAAPHRRTTANAVSSPGPVHSASDDIADSDAHNIQTALGEDSQPKRNDSQGLADQTKPLSAEEFQKADNPTKLKALRDFMADRQAEQQNEIREMREERRRVQAEWHRGIVGTQGLQPEQPAAAPIREKEQQTAAKTPANVNNAPTSTKAQRAQRDRWTNKTPEERRALMGPALRANAAKRAAAGENPSSAPVSKTRKSVSTPATKSPTAVEPRPRALTDEQKRRARTAPARQAREAKAAARRQDLTEKAAVNPTTGKTRAHLDSTAGDNSSGAVIENETMTDVHDLGSGAGSLNADLDGAESRNHEYNVRASAIANQIFQEIDDYEPAPMAAASRLPTSFAGNLERTNTQAASVKSAENRERVARTEAYKARLARENAKVAGHDAKARGLATKPLPAAALVAPQPTSAEPQAQGYAGASREAPATRRQSGRVSKAPDRFAEAPEERGRASKRKASALGQSSSDVEQPARAVRKQTTITSGLARSVQQQSVRNGNEPARGAQQLSRITTVAADDDEQPDTVNIQKPVRAVPDTQQSTRIVRPTRAVTPAARPPQAQHPAPTSASLLDGTTRISMAFIPEHSRARAVRLTMNASAAGVDFNDSAALEAFAAQDQVRSANEDRRREILQAVNRLAENRPALEETRRLYAGMKRAWDQVQHDRAEASAVAEAEARARRGTGASTSAHAVAGDAAPTSLSTDTLGVTSATAATTDRVSAGANTARAGTSHTRIVRAPPPPSRAAFLNQATNDSATPISTLGPNDARTELRATIASKQPLRTFGPAHTTANTSSNSTRPSTSTSTTSSIPGLSKPGFGSLASNSVAGIAAAHIPAPGDIANLPARSKSGDLLRWSIKRTGFDAQGRQIMDFEHGRMQGEGRMAKRRRIAREDQVLRAWEGTGEVEMDGWETAGEGEEE